MGGGGGGPGDVHWGVWPKVLTVTLTEALPREVGTSRGDPSIEGSKWPPHTELTECDGTSLRAVSEALSLL